LYPSAALQKLHSRPEGQNAIISERGCLKSYLLPLTLSVRVLLLIKEEKVKIFKIRHFPFFSRRGVPDDTIRDGVVRVLLRQPLLLLIGCKFFLS